MKKTLSLALSFVMLITSMLAFSANAFAATIADATEIKLGGDAFQITAPVVKEPATDDEAEEMMKNLYFCKFTPEETGYYEFIFDESFTKTSQGAVMSAVVRAEDEEAINMGAWMKLDSLAGDDDIIGGAISEFNLTINVAAKLEAGKTYGLGLINMTASEITTSVTVQKHTHTLKDFDEKSYVDDYDFSYNEDGEKYTACTECNCDYHITHATYYKVKSVKLAKTKYTFNNKEKKPAVTVKDRKGNVLKKGTDYTVYYHRNKKIGTATVTIRFKGNYSGKCERTFKINPKGTSLTKVTSQSKGFTAKWKKQTNNTTGYQIQYSTSSKFTKKATKTVTVKGNTNNSKAVAKLKKNKKYYVRVRTYKTVSGKKYCSDWSKAKTVKTKK